MHSLFWNKIISLNEYIHSGDFLLFYFYLPFERMKAATTIVHAVTIRSIDLSRALIWGLTSHLPRSPCIHTSSYQLWCTSLTLWTTTVMNKARQIFYLHGWSMVEPMEKRNERRRWRELMQLYLLKISLYNSSKFQCTVLMCISVDVVIFFLFCRCGESSTTGFVSASRLVVETTRWYNTCVRNFLFEDRGTDACYFFIETHGM